MKRPASTTLAAIVAGVILLVTGSLVAPSSGAADAVGPLLLSLAVILAAAKLGGHMAARLGQAPVLGELLAGVLIGNLGLWPGLGADPVVDVFARLGVVLLMFEVGLDSTVSELLRVGRSAVLVALCGTIASFGLGWCASRALLPSAPAATHVFLGAAITATSVGISARTLKDLGAAGSAEARVILGAAVVDDVFALVVLAVVGAWAANPAAAGAIAWGQAGGLVAKTLGFLTLALVVGRQVTPRGFQLAVRLRTSGALLAVGLAFCFSLAWAAGAIGLAPLVGAFAAGLVLEDSHSAGFVERGERPLADLVSPLTSFLIPVFFVLIGIRTDLHALGGGVLGLASALSAAAILGKLACALGVVTPGTRRTVVAAAMIPRGEVSLIFAAVGTSLTAGGVPLIDAQGYSAIVAMVFATTLVTPAALRWAIRR